MNVNYRTNKLITTCFQARSKVKLVKFMRLYELVLVAKSSLKDSEQKKLLETIKDWAKSLKVVKEEAWGQKPLAYSIKHELSGVYHLLHFEGENIPSDFEKKILQEEKILRHLLLRKK